jgi:hypothetical protein
MSQPHSSSESGVLSCSRWRRSAKSWKGCAMSAACFGAQLIQARYLPPTRGNVKLIEIREDSRDRFHLLIASKI